MNPKLGLALITLTLTALIILPIYGPAIRRTITRKRG
jgi:hypothetical protein